MGDGVSTRGGMEVEKCGGGEVWKCGSAEVRKCGSACPDGDLRYKGLVILRDPDGYRETKAP